MNFTALILILAGWLVTTMRHAKPGLRLRCLIAVVGVCLITAGMAALI